MHMSTTPSVLHPGSLDDDTQPASFVAPDGAYTINQVGANPGGEACLVTAREGESVLFDAGYAWCAPQTYDNIRAVMGDASVDCLVLTHSHYDHASAAGYLKERMPRMVVASSQHAADVFGRPGAIATMRRLNDSEAHACGLVDYEDVSDSLVIDRVLAEGDTVTVGNLSFSTLAAPGHTKCCLAFWCASERLLISCETAGVYDGPLPVEPLPDGTPIPAEVKFMVEMPVLTGYRSSLDFIARAQALDPRVLVVPHYGVLEGQGARDYLVAADFWARYAAKLIMAAHRAGRSDQQIIAAFKRLFYTPYGRFIQPEPAFDLNASYTIPRIIGELS